jgi:large subunit ribosomal protein L29
MKAKELREKSVAELKEQLTNNRKELFNMRFLKASGQLENTAKLRVLKKDVARIKTILTATKIAK